MWLVGMGEEGRGGVALIKEFRNKSRYKKDFINLRDYIQSKNRISASWGRRPSWWPSWRGRPWGPWGLLPSLLLRVL